MTPRADVVGSGISVSLFLFIFFFNDTATTEIYTLSLHDALPISRSSRARIASNAAGQQRSAPSESPMRRVTTATRSEEHTSELQSHVNLVCRLLLEKKKKKIANEDVRSSKSLTFTPKIIATMSGP